MNQFDEYYKDLFASTAEFNEWKKQMLASTHPILRFNPANEKRLKSLWKESGYQWVISPHYKYTLEWPKEVALGEALPGYEEHLFYVQNASSLFPVMALDPQPGEKILDACAAPGGKALFIAELMQGEGEFLANDLSRDRRIRMHQIFKEYGVEDFVQIMGRNAMGFAKSHPEYFDRILVDAPCSSEKHVLASPKHLEEWKPGRVRHLKKLQWSLLKTLWKALKPGGRLVYATCSVAPEENEELIQKFVQREKEGAVLKEIKRIQPSAEGNLDPMFISVLEK